MADGLGDLLRVGLGIHEGLLLALLQLLGYIAQDSQLQGGQRGPELRPVDVALGEPVDQSLGQLAVLPPRPPARCRKTAPAAPCAPARRPAMTPGLISGGEEEGCVGTQGYRGNESLYWKSFQSVVTC